jgi:endonuclease/exonuclease/phosphatase family metal-dependent hydrolase
LGVGPITQHHKKFQCIRKSKRERKPGGPIGNRPKPSKKDNDLRICTWNVRSLNPPSTSKEELINVLNSYKADLTAVQELNWPGVGIKELQRKQWAIYHSGQEKKKQLGCGFVVGPRLKDRVIKWEPINERMCLIRLKARFFNISVICCHAPTEEEKDEVNKDIFYDNLSNLYDSCPSQDAKIVIGDFNAQIGKEGIFGETTGCHTYHEKTNDNGFRLIELAAMKGLIVSSTKFPHPDIHKYTWIHPNPNIKSYSQIDHMLIDRRHSSCVLDVRSWRGANVSSDHYLVMSKVRIRISTQYHNFKRKTKRINIEQLKSPEAVERFASTFSQKVSDNPIAPSSSVNEHWRHIRENLNTAAVETIGYQQPPRTNSWFDDECRSLTKLKNEARMKWIQEKDKIQTRHRAQISYSRYRQLRTQQRQLIWRKKREYDQHQFEQLATYQDRNEVRKFYKKVKAMQSNDGFKPRTSVCKDKNGNLITDTTQILERWSEYFKEHLDGCNPPEQNVVTSDPIPLTESENEPPPTSDEIACAIKSLKNNKSPGTDGLPAELFKCAGPHLVGSMHQLIAKIWTEEVMPDEWRNCLITPVFKKGDRLECSNHRGIGVLNVAYKILSKTICSRLKPHMDNTIRNYQCGFRPGKSTIDQIFTLRQILEKTREYNITRHHLFIDFKAAYDSIERSKLFSAMADFNFPQKLINLSKMILACTLCAVKIDNDISSYFRTLKGFIQGDGISCDFFNIALEKIIREAQIQTRGTTFTKSVQILGFADDIDLVGWTKEDINEAFQGLEREARQLGLKVNETKTKYMLTTKQESLRQRIGQSVQLGEYNFEVVEEFIYLGSLLNANGDNTSKEISRRIIMANRCFYGLIKLVRSRTLPKSSKLILYKTLILPVLMYGSETWTMTQADENQLGVFERKILRQILGPINDGGVWRRKMNTELYNEFNDTDVVKKIKIQQLRWLGHLVRMNDDAPAKMVFDHKPLLSRPIGRPKLRWKDKIEQSIRDLLNLDRPWRLAASDRDYWRSSLNSA